MVLLARKDEEGNTQALYDHLHGAGRLASGFEDEFADISRTAAVLHDVGKVAQQFQTYLLSDDGHRGDVQHARQGAFVVNDFFESKGEIEEIAKEILELAISKHHGGLPDCIDESGNRAFLLGFTESDKSNEKYAYQEIKRGLNGLALDLQSNFRGSAEDIACFLKKIKSLRLSKDSIYFYLGLLVKLIYSRLVDADRTDAACFETRKQYRPNAVDWQNLISRLDKSMRSFDSSSEINRIRHQINGNLLTTYEMIQGASGQTPHSAEKDGDADAAKRALIPYGHTTLPVSLTVLVDANGCIRGVAKRKSTIIIPCTEESMGRTIKPVPHPLFDQLQYVDSGRSPEKTSMYLQQLAKWKGDDAKLEAVFKCVSEHSISEAAAHYGVELTDKDDKAGVCFSLCTV
mgnify:CR=1 FL=1